MHTISLARIYKPLAMTAQLSIIVLMFSMVCLLPDLHAQETDRPVNAEPAQAASPEFSEYFTSRVMALDGGVTLDEFVINGPPAPPPGYELDRSAAALPEPDQFAGTNSLTVPAFNWVFGCSSVSGAMIAGYYDRNGYPNIYTGPTNGGVMPLDNSSWPTWSDGYTTYPNLPLAASHNGVDGRTTRGSIDDYWIKYGNTDDDPYITNGWTQHTWGDAIGDYMKTSQSGYGNSDGSTTFYTYTSSAAALTCADMVSYNISNMDGTYGRKLFYEARGYTVTDCYNQKTDNNITGGFSFAQYKAEIDAGRPVMLNLVGHTIVGVGYDDSSNTVYIHDTWDYNTHSMTWGSSYSGMQLLSVSIVNLQGASPVVSAFRINNGAASTTSATVTLNNKVIGSTPTQYMASESSSFTGASWLTYASVPSFTLSSGFGTKTVYFKVKNASGTASAAVRDTIQYVEAAPVVSAFRINNGAASTTSAKVTLNNKVIGSTPTQYMASESSSFTGASWLTYASVPSFTLSSGPGTKTVYFKVKNSSGMESAAVRDTIQYVEAAPVVSAFRINNGAASTTSATVTLNNRVTGSTPTQYMASESSSFTGASWLAFSSAPSFTLSSGFGTKAVYFKVKNASGMESAAVRDTIQYVAAAPVASAFRINNGAASTTSATVTLNNKVTGSTPTQYMASESSSFTGASWLTDSSALSFTLNSGFGTKTVYFKVKNASGAASAAVSDGIEVEPVTI